MEDRPIGPYDNPSAFAFNPQGFLIGEVNGKLIGCITSSYHIPKSSFFCGRNTGD